MRTRLILAKLPTLEYRIRTVSCLIVYILCLVNDWPYGNSFQKSFPPQACDLVPNINGILGVSVTNLLVELTVRYCLNYWIPQILDKEKQGEKKTSENKMTGVICLYG